MYRVKGFFGIFCDAVVKDQFGQAVFVSLIGNDSSLQELAAKLSLSPNTEGSIQSVTIDCEGEEFTFSASQLSQKNAQRLPESARFKGLHAFWSSKKLHPQFAEDGCGYVLFNPITETDKSINLKLWNAIKQVSKIPLLDKWQSLFLQIAKEREWIKELEARGKVNGLEVCLPSFEELADAISHLVVSGTLTK
ncbi:MAG: hypothetical protein CMK64_05055 [Pseudoalteromonas sp.]|nr:hypothetical protein [Pseudoalteromonas sp.]|tara:strand:- start:21553 stop:22131 length:579 start_codon:yes stop_codon:yes gene_type:complete